MKLTLFLIFVGVFFVLALLFGHINWSNYDVIHSLDFSSAISITMLAVGGLIAAVSLFVLLQRGLAGHSLDQSIPLVVALVGGIALCQITWSAALALAVIAAAVVLARAFGSAKPPSTPPPPPET